MGDDLRARRGTALSITSFRRETVAARSSRTITTGAPPRFARRVATWAGSNMPAASDTHLTFVETAKPISRSVQRLQAVIRAGSTSGAARGQVFGIGSGQGAFDDGWLFGAHSSSSTPSLLGCAGIPARGARPGHIGDRTPMPGELRLGLFGKTRQEARRRRQVVDEAVEVVTARRHVREGGGLCSAS
jgi:hypothetical protein